MAKCEDIRRAKNVAIEGAKAFAWDAAKHIRLDINEIRVAGQLSAAHLLAKANLARQLGQVTEVARYLELRRALLVTLAADLAYLAGQAGQAIGILSGLAQDLYRINQYYNDLLKDCDPIATSPLILDLDGDGVEADAITYFDHSGDGWTELSRWADEDDGVLVWDRNNDGVINDGSELFGDNTVLANGNKAAHGFAALADLDDNGDGVLDSSDSAWANLKVMRWTDDNNNDIKDDGEESLVTLDSLAIESLNTGFANSNHVDSSGNEHRQEGGYTKTVINDDGTTETITRKMTDVWFVTSTGATQYDDSDIPTHSTEIEALPDIQGYGRTYNLRDAMALDDATDAEGNSRLTAPYYSNNRTETRSLREMVAAFTATNTDGSPNLDKTAREALAEKII